LTLESVPTFIIQSVQPARPLRSGELAKLAGVSPDTLRYYERNRLLPAPPRAANGYRCYPAQSLERVQLIRRALGLGFSVEELASHSSTARCLQGRHASFWRHGEIYRKGRRPSLGQASTRPSAQPFDEFPVGYSWASCSPAEPASASPTVFHFAVNGQSRRDCVAHTSSPPQTGLDAQKTSRCPAREKCFSLTSPLIEPATVVLKDTWAKVEKKQTPRG
jgi:hypothetical protein